MTINQSHGGSVKQTRAVIDGQEADLSPWLLLPISIRSPSTDLSRKIGSLVCRIAAHPTLRRLFSSCGKKIQKEFATGQTSLSKAFR